MAQTITCPNGHPIAAATAACPVCQTGYDGPPPPRAQLPADQDLAKWLAAAPIGLAGPPGDQAFFSQQDDRYVLEDELARGGMGVVLRAVDPDIHREIAVKYLLDQASASKRLRFIEEAQITGQLEHPNIVPIHDFGCDAEGRLRFTMKMVKGRTLAQILGEWRVARGERLEAGSAHGTLSRLLAILVNVCHALAYAHARGVVHRDLKPANIMVGDFGEVYVMDWGLAKVMNSAVSGQQSEPTSLSQRSDKEGTVTDARVVTDRMLQEEMTQDGAILGTPVYMAPEQAAGRIEAIDQRSDIYALGAILYEMLTLQPPVDMQGGRLEILRRVVQGEIVPPQERLRRTGSKRRIPPEPAAMALKAMARAPGQRYPTVESFRQDLQRYLEGRSVTAREDSKREMLVKFVKRNKGLSAGIAAVFLVLVVGVAFISHALLEMNAAFAAYQTEQDENLELDRKKVPTLLQAARLLINEKHFADALAQVELALSFDPDASEARLLRGKLLIGEQRYKEAREELQACLELKPGEKHVTKWLVLCTGSIDPGRLLALADDFARQRASTLADRIRVHAEELLADYRKRVDAVCPGRSKRLTVDDRGLHLDLSHAGNVKDLKPLAGMPLATLDLTCPLTATPYELSDISPLKGMPLVALSLSNAVHVRDVSPLEGMPLTRLYMQNLINVTDLTPLKDLPLTALNLWDCYSVKDLTPLKGMPLTELELWSCASVSDVSVLKGMKLTHLTLPQCVRDRDLLLLKDMPLTFLSIQTCPHVESIAPLAGMKLKYLSIGDGTKVRDLSPIAGMPLSTLRIWNTPVQDLTPLAGMKLRQLIFTPKNITRGLEVVRQMKSLEDIGTSWESKLNWPADVFWKKYDAGDFKK